MRTPRATASVILGLTLLVSGCMSDSAPTEDRTRSGVAATATATAADDARDRRPSRSRAEAGGAGWGPSPSEVRRAERLVSRLPLRRLAGQVIVARYSGTRAPGGLVTGLDLGGVIVMADNVRDVDRLRRANRTLQRAVAQDGRRWPAFIGVDQEGGVVERVKDRATRFPAFMSTGAADDTGLTRRAARAAGGELAHLGFTAVFAPSADVTSGRRDPTIGSRSAGSRPKLVARHASAAVSGHERAGLLPVVKHFPGHGSVPADSHVSLPVQRASLAQLRRRDLLPFRVAIGHGVPAVMTGHVDVRAVDPGVPASLSRRVVTGLLRRDLGFRGLVVTDALNMGAVTARWSSAAAAVRALRAGNDVLLMPPDPRAARDGIVDAVRSGRLTRQRLVGAAARQVAWLLHQRADRPRQSPPPGSAAGASYRLSAGAVTVVSGRCRGRLVGRAVRGVGSAEVVHRFHAAARRAGLRTGAGDTVAFTGYRGTPRTADVVVSTDAPYVLGSSRGRSARIALYGDTPGAMRALVDVLRGRAKAPGRLPVRVADVPRTGC